MSNSQLTLKRFKELFQSLYPSLCLFANSYLNDKDTSKDVTQEVFINIWEKKVNFESDTAAKSFLYTAVKNKCIDLLRSSRVKLTEHPIKIDFLDQKETDSHFYKEVLSAETAGIIKRAVEKLPPKCQKIILLSMREYSNHDIAKELSVSVNTVKTQKKIGYKKLREILDKQQ